MTDDENQICESHEVPLLIQMNTWCGTHQLCLDNIQPTLKQN